MPSPEQLNIPLNVCASADLVETPETAAAAALISQLQAGQVAAGLLVGRHKSGKSLIAASAEARGITVIDDAPSVMSERDLFHAINWARETRTALLLTSALNLSDWPVEMPDLSSRLRAMPFAEITPPSEGTMRLLLAKRFSDHQTRIDAAVIDFAVARLERSYRALDKLVDEANRRALAEQRRITVPLLREVLVGDS